MIMTKVSDVNLIHLEYISRVLKTRINPTFHELQLYLPFMGGGQIPPIPQKMLQSSCFGLKSASNQLVTYKVDKFWAVKCKIFFFSKGVRKNQNLEKIFLTILKCPKTHSKTFLSSTLFFIWTFISKISAFYGLKSPYFRNESQNYCSCLSLPI